MHKYLLSLYIAYHRFWVHKHNNRKKEHFPLVFSITGYIVLKSNIPRVSLTAHPRLYTCCCFICCCSFIFLFFFMPLCPDATNNPNCSACNKYVRSGILCGICNRWTHTKCNNLTPTDFNTLKNSEDKWFCITCITSIFPFNSKSNFSTVSNKDTSNIKNFFTELNSSEDFDNGNGVDNLTGIDCKYYDSEEFIEQFAKSKYFSAFHLNIASLTKHYDELQTLLSLLDVNFSVIGITETKFTKKHSTIY